MDDPALQRRLDAIRRRQRLVVGLLAGLYLVGLGELIGYWKAGAVAVVALLLLATVGLYQRRSRSVT